MLCILPATAPPVYRPDTMASVSSRSSLQMICVRHRIEMFTLEQAREMAREIEGAPFQL